MSSKDLVNKKRLEPFPNYWPVKSIKNQFIKICWDYFFFIKNRQKKCFEKKINEKSVGYVRMLLLYFLLSSIFLLLFFFCEFGRFCSKVSHPNILNWIEFYLLPSNQHTCFCGKWDSVANFMQIIWISKNNWIFNSFTSIWSSSGTGTSLLVLSFMAREMTYCTCFHS